MPRGSSRGTIRRRSPSNPNSWTVQIYLGMDPVTGKRRFRTATAYGSWDDAERLRTKLLWEKDGGVVILPSGMSVEQYLEEWLRYGAMRVRPRTLLGYESQVRRYILPRIGMVRLERLTPRHVHDMEANLLAHGGYGGRPLSARTVLQTHRILSSALSQAVKLELVPRNVVSLVDAPRASRHDIRTLSFEGIRDFLDGIPNRVHRAIMLLAVQTGLRRSELAGLQWRDIDLQSGTISVRHSLVQLRSGNTELSDTKSGHGRVVPLVGDSLSVLYDLRAQAGSKLAGEDVSGDAFLFHGRGGGPLLPDSITQLFRRAAQRAGLKGVRLHDLRHTHASLMLSAGVHLKVVSERLGHSSVAITGDIYSHVLPSVQLEAVERFGALWSESRAPEDPDNVKRLSNPDKPPS